MTQTMLDSILNVDFPRLLNLFQSAFIFVLISVVVIFALVMLSHFVQNMKHQQQKKRRSYRRTSSVPMGQVSGVRAYNRGSSRSGVRNLR